MTDMRHMRHMRHLAPVAAEDIKELDRKERSYAGSWKKRGGVGAWMMLARKVDRLEHLQEREGGAHRDIFEGIAADPSGADGSVLAEVRDLRRYLMLVEAEMVARGVVKLEAAPPLGAQKDSESGQRIYDLNVALESEQAQLVEAEGRLRRYAELALDILPELRPLAEVPGAEGVKVRALIQRIEELAVPKASRGI